MAKRILICTDLDRTLLPNGPHSESPGARERFARLVAHPEITLAYVSGRHKALIEAAIRDYHLPQPDWVVADVGTTIYRVCQGQWKGSVEWAQAIAPDWRGLTATDLRPLFQDLPELRLQEAFRQNRFKLSFYLSSRIDVEALREVMRRRLQSFDLKASLIYSVDEASQTGLLDVLPACATKLQAVEFLIQHGFESRNTVFAGDSGNDLPVLISPIPAVLVANADRAVIEGAEALVAKQGSAETFYLARGGFLGMNGYYSAGILEGIVHYLPETLAWIA